jgi:hypothetical protein
MLQQVFTAKTSNGQSLEVDHGGGEIEVVVYGTFGGGTATLQAKYADTATWVPVSNGAWTTAEMRLLKTIRPCKLRLDLTGATSPSLNAWM